MTSILGRAPSSNGSRPHMDGAPLGRPVSLLTCRWLLPRVGRGDLQVPALQRSRRVRVVVILDQQRPPRVRGLLVTEPTEQSEGLIRCEDTGERSLEPRRIDAGGGVAVERREDPRAARGTGAVVVPVA